MTHSPQFKGLWTRMYFALIILCPLNFKFVFVRRNCRSVLCVHNIITMIIIWWFMVWRCFRLLTRFAPLGAGPSIFEYRNYYTGDAGFGESFLWTLTSPSHDVFFIFFDGCGNIAIIMVQLQYLSNRKIVPREIIEVFRTPV